MSEEARKRNTTEEHHKQQNRFVARSKGYLHITLEGCSLVFVIIDRSRGRTRGDFNFLVGGIGKLENCRCLIVLEQGEANFRHPRWCMCRSGHWRYYNAALGVNWHGQGQGEQQGEKLFHNALYCKAERLSSHARGRQEMTSCYKIRKEGGPPTQFATK